MKKIGEIMQEMGFKKDAPDSVKEAFIKHLVYASTGTRLENNQSKSHQPELTYKHPTEPEQLSLFDVENKKVV